MTITKKLALAFALGAGLLAASPALASDVTSDRHYIPASRPQPAQFVSKGPATKEQAATAPAAPARPADTQLACGCR